MQNPSWALSLLFTVSVLGCLEPEPAVKTPVPPEGNPAPWKGCLYTVATVESPESDASHPSRYDVLLVRSDAGGCPWGEQRRVLESSHGRPETSLLVGPEGILVGHTRVPGPSGPDAQAVHYSLWSLAPDTLEPRRHETLVASRCPRGRGACVPGQISEVTLSVSGGTLSLEGTKAGSLPGEIGEGPRFTATYPDFFTTSTPVRVFAPPDENSSYVALEWAGCHFFVWALPTTGGEKNAEDYNVFVTRIPRGEACPWGLGSQRIDEHVFAPEAFAIVGSASGVTVGYKRREGPSGKEPVALRLARLTWDTLTPMREERLEVRKEEAGGSHPGALTLVHLSVDQGEDLVVLGHKDGHFRGEPGAAAHFQLLFEDFFTSTRPPLFGAF
jgi:hypothetical protein